MERGEIYDQTFNLYETHCKGCTGWQKVAPRRVHKAAEEYCNNVCPIGRKMRDLGDLILFGRPVKTARELIKEVYQQEKEDGLTDVQIYKKYGISKSNLHCRKVHWGLVERKDLERCNQKTYLEHKKKGFPDDYIAEKMGIGSSTLRAKKREWGIKIRSDQSILKGLNGEDITIHTYIAHKENGLQEKEIMELWGVSPSVITRRKKRWRLEHPDIDLSQYEQKYYWGAIAK